MRGCSQEQHPARGKQWRLGCGAIPVRSQPTLRKAQELGWPSELSGLKGWSWTVHLELTSLGISDTLGEGVTLLEATMVN